MKKMLTVALILVAVFIFSAPSVLAQGEPCTADFDCNGNVDANDVTTFLSQFGRSPFNDPCPDCYDSPCPCTTAGCDPPAPVPKTGQTTLYATGDDGDLEKGVAWPNPRFTDNGDGTVTDNLTNLIWLKDTNCFDTRLWNNALSDSNGLEDGECGLTDGSNAGDWRLPNYKELFSLVDAENYAPPLPSGHPFNNVRSCFYWSATTYATNLTYYDDAWCLYMGEGTVLHRNKTSVGCVWPVRDPL